MANKAYKNIKKVGLAIIAFEGTEHLYNIISTLRDSVDYVSCGLQMTSYHGEPISNVDLNEIFRLRDEDHLIDNMNIQHPAHQSYQDLFQKIFSYNIHKNQ